MDIHINDFYKNCAAICLTIYQSFPRRVPVYVEDIIGLEPTDEFGLPSKRHQDCLGAMFWLKDVGLIDYDGTVGFEAIENATLTEKGFIKMTSLVLEVDENPVNPFSIKKNQATLAFQLRSTLKNKEYDKLIEFTCFLFEKM